MGVPLERSRTVLDEIRWPLNSVLHYPVVSIYISIIIDFFN